MTNPLPIDELIYARWVIPIVPRNRIFHNCCIAINQQRIVSITPQKEAEQRFAPRVKTQLNNHILLPGLVNCHGHAAMSLLRGFADDLPLQKWLEAHIWPAEQKWVNSEFVHDGTQLAMAEMLKTGTTCFSDMYFFPEATAHAAKEAGMRAQICFPVLDFPSAWAKSAEEYIHKGLELHDKYRSDTLIQTAFGPHAPYTVSEKHLQTIVTYANELQTNIQIHLHETAFEVTSSLENTGHRPVARLHQLGMLTPNTQCVHMTQLVDEDTQRLISSGAHVIHCPKSNMKLASGACPTQHLVDQNINVALGTDGAASNNQLSLFDELRFAALLGKLTASNAAAIDATTALEMATINGAKALGKESEIGSLEAGKSADIIAIEVDSIEQQPLYNVSSQLVYTNLANKVAYSWVRGKRLVDHYQLTSLDETAISAKVTAWQNRLQPSFSEI